MEPTSPMEVLEGEHHVIQKMVGAMAVLGEGLGAGQPPPVEALHKIVEFMRTFADTCHHGKEEAHLFPFLETRGVPARGCPIGVLIQEHERGGPSWRSSPRPPRPMRAATGRPATP